MSQKMKKNKINKERGKESNSYPKRTKEETLELTKKYWKSDFVLTLVLLNALLLSIYMVASSYVISQVYTALERNNSFYQSDTLVDVKSTEINLGDNLNAIVEENGKNKRIYFNEESTVYCNVENNCVLQDSKTNEYILVLGVKHLLTNGVLLFKDFKLVLLCTIVNIFILFYYCATANKGKSNTIKVWLSRLLEVFLIGTTIFYLCMQFSLFGNTVVEYWN